MIELQYENCQKLHRVLGALLKKNNKDMFTIDIKDGFFELQVIEHPCNNQTFFIYPDCVKFTIDDTPFKAKYYAAQDRTLYAICLKQVQENEDFKALRKFNDILNDMETMFKVSETMEDEDDDK